MNVDEEILAAGEDTGQPSAPRVTEPTTAEQTPLLGNVSIEAVPEEDHDAQWANAKWWARPSVLLLLAPFSLLTMAYGGIAIPKLNVILELVCGDYYSDRDQFHDGKMAMSDGDRQCQTPEVQALVSRFALYISLIAGCLAALTSPKLGAYSDRYGRRMVLALSSFGLMSSEVSTILAMKYPQIFSVNLLLVGAVIEGLTGSFLLAMAVATSYSADCTSVADRAVSFGYFQGSLFLGIAVGPALSGLIIKATGDVLLVFYIALVIHGIFVAYVVFILPESVSLSRMAMAQRKYAIAQSQLKEASRNQPQTILTKLRLWNPLKPLSILYPTGPGSSPRLRMNLVLLAIADTLTFGVGMGGVMVIIYYAELKFGWHNYESSMFVAVVNTTRVLMLFVILPLVVKTIYTRSQRRRASISSEADSYTVIEDAAHSGADNVDLNFIRLSIVTEFLGYLGYAVAATGPQFTLAGMLTAIGGIGMPTIRSALTKHIPRDKIGQLLGASALLHSLARVVFPAVFNLVYAETVGTFPQAVFVCCASVWCIIAGCSIFITPHVKLHEDEHGNLVDRDHLAN